MERQRQRQNLGGRTRRNARQSAREKSAHMGARSIIAEIAEGRAYVSMAARGLCVLTVMEMAYVST